MSGASAVRTEPGVPENVPAAAEDAAGIVTDILTDAATDIAADMQKLDPMLAKAGFHIFVKSGFYFLHMSRSGVGCPFRAACFYSAVGGTPSGMGQR